MLVLNMNEAIDQLSVVYSVPSCWHVLWWKDWLYLEKGI